MRRVHGKAAIALALAALLAVATASLAATMSTAAADGAVVAYVTVPDKEVAKRIAAELVEAKLAACVNILPGVESVYWWEGKVETDPELLLKVKTRASLVPRLAAAVKATHPYDVPEVIAVPIVGGLPEYLSWLDDSTRPAE